MLKSLGENEYVYDKGVMLVDKYTALIHETTENNEELGKVVASIMEYARKGGMEVIWGRVRRISLNLRISTPKKRRRRSSLRREGCSISQLKLYWRRDWKTLDVTRNSSMMEGVSMH